MEPISAATTAVPNSCLASVLASHQHYFWKNQLGFLVHPETELNTNPTALKIAEIGTETGLWLLDLAKRLPASTTLHGYSIDISSVPPPHSLPANISIHRVPSYTDPSPFPDDLLESYDIIHITSLASSIKDNNPGPVIQSAMGMLKPKGSIQWSEPDTYLPPSLRSSYSPSSSPSSTPALSALLSRASTDLNGNPRGWIDSLPDILARYGLAVQPGQHRWRMPDAYARVGTDAWVLGLGLVVARRGVDGGSEKEEEEEGLGKLVERAGEECMKKDGGVGLGVRVDMVVAVGRKEG